MKPKDVVKHFGGIRPAAKALGVERQTIYMWLKRGAIPTQRQYQIHVNTDGVLRISK